MAQTGLYASILPSTGQGLSPLMTGMESCSWEVPLTPLNTTNLQRAALLPSMVTVCRLLHLLLCLRSQMSSAMMLGQPSSVIFSAFLLGPPYWIPFPRTNVTEKSDYLKCFISPSIEQEQAGEYFLLHQLNIYNSEAKRWFSLLASSSTCRTAWWFAVHEISVKEQQYFTELSVAYLTAGTY